MKKRWLCGALVLALGLGGCGRQVEETTDDDTTRLGTSIDVKLSEWLELPRAKLAELASETHDRVANQLKDCRPGGPNADSVILLPQLRMPLTVPVLHEAKYSEKLGISLPPYVKEGQRDNALALHLAQHGDVEAALKLVDPADAELVQRLEAQRLKQNYPVEWTRLVALTLQEAELKMATADVDGATELVLLQRELHTLLDAKAASGPLGAALLPIGQRALKEAAAAWNSGANQKPAVAEEIEATLKDWGEPPAPQPAFAPGASRSDLAQVLTEIDQGRMLAAKSPAQLQRVLDLQNLPVISEGLEGVVAWFNDKDQLVESWYLYSNQIGHLFPSPQHLAHHLVEHGVSGKEADKVGELPHQSYASGKLVYDFTQLPLSPILGAVLRVTAEGSSAPLGPAFPADPRVFGVLNLNRTFEQTRVELAPEEASGKTLTLKKKEVLAQIEFPLGEPRPAQVVLERAGNHNLFSSLTLQWPAEDKFNFSRLLTLWGTYGPSRIDSPDHNLVLTWENPTLRLTLAYNGLEPATFTVRDLRGDKEAEERLKTATALDLEQRKIRREQNKQLVLLPRFVQWPELELGLSHEETQKVLNSLPLDLKPRKEVKAADGSVSILFAGDAPKSATYHPMQLVVRFGPNNKLTEVRVRYQEGPAQPTAASPALLDLLKKAGAPEPLPAPWLDLWTDFSTPKKALPICYRWVDDRTVLTYQRDTGNAEVSLKDSPADQPLGVPLPPLEICSRGLEACQLGDSRAELVKRWKIDRPVTTADGGLVVFQPAKSPYDMVVVYFEDNKAVRLLAQHRERPPSANEDFSNELAKFWKSDLDRLGVVRRVDKAEHKETNEPVVHGYSWHDDRTRIHTFAEQRKDGYRLFTEWRQWPIKVVQMAAKP